VINIAIMVFILMRVRRRPPEPRFVMQPA
jgi:hypothetical protein